jgi:hypothetical protein
MTSTSPPQIQSIYILGERASGTNFLTCLLRDNTSNVRVVIDAVWKHGFVRSPLPGNLNRILVVHIYRNVYDYLRSMYKNPWESHDSLRQLSFTDFIRAQWRASIYASQHLYEDKDEKGNWFPNIIRMRTAKLQNMNHVVVNGFAKHFISIAYESLVQDPQSFLKRLRDEYKISLRSSFRPISFYKGDHSKPFVARPYFALTPDDLKFIRSQIDFPFERSLGYKPFEISSAPWKIPALLHCPLPGPSASPHEITIQNQMHSNWKRLNSDYEVRIYTFEQQQNYIERILRQKGLNVTLTSDLADSEWSVHLLFGITILSKEGGFYIGPFVQAFEPLRRFLHDPQATLVFNVKHNNHIYFPLLGSVPNPNLLDTCSKFSNRPFFESKSLPHQNVMKLPTLPRSDRLNHKEGIWQLGSILNRNIKTSFESQNEAYLLKHKIIQ